jgi:phosphate-selective porin OprO/OprP
MAVGAFGGNVNSLGEDHQMTISTRFVLTPVNNTTSVAHLGLSGRLRDIGEKQGEFRYRQRPIAHVPGRFVSTGAIAEREVFVGAEAAAILGPFWTAGEYARAFVNCSPAAEAASRCASDPQLDGGYAEVGVVIGGRRTYKAGSFDRTEVSHSLWNRGLGALSLVARYDTLDLTKGLVDGGAYDAFIVGADWQLNKFIRLGINAFKTEVALGSRISGLDADIATYIQRGVDETDVKGVILRAQVDF